MAAAFSPNGKDFVLGTTVHNEEPDNRTAQYLILSSVDDFVELCRLKADAGDYYKIEFELLRFLPARSNLILGITNSPRRGLRLWDAAQMKEIWSRDLREVAVGPRSMDVSFDGRYAVTGVRRARLWAADSGQMLLELGNHKTEVRAVAFARSGYSVATADVDGNVVVSRAEDGQEIWRFRGKDMIVTAMAFGLHDRTLIVGGFRGHLRFIDAKTGLENFSLDAHSGHIEAMDVGQDGLTLATAAEDTIKLWDLSRLGL
jgi:WD40 repeat protein